MSGQFLGEIRLMPYNFAPKTWAYCAGQILSIQQNTALFSLLGVTYGGNGVTTFALPDLRGRCVVGSGTSQGFPNPGTNVIEGTVQGTETVTLIPSQLPMHNHMWLATTVLADAAPPLGNYLAQPKQQQNPQMVYDNLSAAIPLAPATTGLTGGNQPHENMQPYLVLAYCIALQGIFPSRN